MLDFDHTENIRIKLPLSFNQTESIYFKPLVGLNQTNFFSNKGVILHWNGQRYFYPFLPFPVILKSKILRCGVMKILNE